MRRLIARAGVDRLMFAVSIIAVVIAGITYTGYVQRQSDHRWCELITTLDEGYQSSPQQPTTPRGVKLRDDIHQLRKDLGC